MSVSSSHVGASRPIAIISHAHPSVSKGGAEIAAATVFSGLRKLGVPAVFISAVPRKQKARLDLGPDEYAVFYDPEHYDHLYHLAMPETSRQLCAIIKRTGAELLNFHHFLYFGLNSMREAASLPQRRVVMVLHEFLSMCHHHGQMITRPNYGLCKAATPSGCANCFPDLGRQRFELRHDAFQACYGLVADFISPSLFLAQRFQAWGISRDRLHVIENGLALDLPEKYEPRPPHQDTFVFGYFGQLNPFKGGDILLRAADLLATMPQPPGNIEIRVHGNIIGQSDEFRTKLQEMCGRLTFLKFMGPYANREVLGLMGQCDYIVTPSVWWENSPVVIQEAYASGRPVICSGIGGMAEKVINGINGLHFQPGDAASLLAAMLTASDRVTFARLQRGVPRPYGAAEMAQRYMQVFDRTSNPITANSAVPFAQRAEKKREMPRSRGKVQASTEASVTR